jgi:hypothetical protein
MPTSQEVWTGEDREVAIDEVQRSGRMVFLQTAGYTTAQIAGFGDLVKLPE